MSERPNLPDARKLTFEVLHPIRDYVIAHGARELPGHPLKYLRFDIYGEGEEKLVVCVHDTDVHTRMRISRGDRVAADRLMVIVYEDEPESWIKFDVTVDPEDLITLAAVIRASEGDGGNASSN